MFNYDADLQLISSELWCCGHLKTILSFNLWELLAMCVFGGGGTPKPKSLFLEINNNIKISNPFIV